MTTNQIKRLLYTIYCAGFNHGSNEGPFPEHGTFEAFDRLIVGKSPMQDNATYTIKEKVESLLALGVPDDVEKKSETGYLCKCNNCDTIMIDQNPQVGAVLHQLKGNEVEMQFVQGLVKSEGDKEMFWACPVCLTDEYLTDL